jgi:hypothetical protein
MRRVLHPLLLAATSAATAASAAPANAPAVGATIAAMRSFAKAQGDKLWPGYGAAPFGFLLVAGDKEQLLCQSPAPDGFTADGKDAASGCVRYVRARSGLPDTLLAAMPVFGPPSTIVMGTPETTGRSDADWTRTILHEHFHQWQDSLPKFFERAAALGLAGEDHSGMWMLNYPFPYSDPRTVAAFDTAAGALGAAVDARGKPGFKAKVAAYLAARRNLARTAGEKNWRYAEFELWKEGVARWTEVELGKRYPDAAVSASAEELDRKARAWLDKPDLARAGREFVYPYGAAEAKLLEACWPAWRREYPKLLALRPLLEKAQANCRG